MRIVNTKGFTLIELLVVIVLLGIVTSFAVLSMGTGSAEREMEDEAKRLHGLIKLVQEESIIQAKEIVMEINKNEFSFLEYKEKKWMPLEGKVFRARKINKALYFKVETDKKTVLFKAKKEQLLRLYFLSSGEQSPFEIKVNIKDTPKPYYQLVGHFNGKVELKRINEFGD